MLTPSWQQGGKTWKSRIGSLALAGPFSFDNLTQGMQKDLNRACENNFPEFVKCAKDYKKLPGSAFKHKRCDRQKLNRSVELIKKVAESLVFLFCKQMHTGHQELCLQSGLGWDVLPLCEVGRACGPDGVPAPPGLHQHQEGDPQLLVPAQSKQVSGQRGSRGQRR